MKILQINSVCGVGSTGRIATDLYKVLEEQGHECKIAYGRGKAPEGIDSIKIGSNLDNYIHVFKTRVFDKHGFGSINATKKLINKIEQYNPDIIHIHNIHGYYANIKILFNYLKKIGKPIVWTLHDCWTFTGHCAHYDYIKCDKWINGCYKCPQKNEYPSSRLLDNSKFNYDMKKELFTLLEDITIVTPSQWLANEVSKSFFNKYKVKVINNGIDLNIFKPRQSNFRKKFNVEDKFIVLGVASTWTDKKGLQYFVELDKRLSSEYKIVVVGVSEKQKKDLSENIIAITRTDTPTDLAEIYTEADVFVNTTLEEVMGLVNVEALACGTPVITFDTGGSVECIDENCGAVVQKTDMEELIAKIEWIKTKGKKQFSEYGIQRARKLYENNQNYYKYLEIYESVVNQKEV